MKKYSWIALVVLLLATLSCRTLSGSGSSSAPSYNAVATISPAAPPTSPLPNYTDQLASQSDLVALYQRANPGVVSISITTQDGAAQGSGFVIDKEGHIVTNLHVVDGAIDLEVDFPSGYKAWGNVVGTDKDSDIAVVKVDAPANELTPLTLGDSDQLQVGQTVVAIGNPFGLSGTMTVGIVSAKGRTLESLRQTADGLSFTAGDILQTDAAINPGNSGGPLLNLNGEVIGINRAIRTTNYTASGEPTNTGIGFAVSINIVKRVVPSLIAGGKYDYPYLGISSRDSLTLSDQELLKLPRSTGAYVLDVVAGGPADQAGLKAGSTETSVPGLNSGGDLIIAVDGRPVVVFGDLLSYLINYKAPGDEITLTIIRANQEKEVKLTLGKRP